MHSKNVIAIEPQPRQAEALRRSMPRNVRIVETALSDVLGVGLLQMSSPEGGSGSRLVSSLNEGHLELPVRLMRMDDLDHGRVGFVKIDAEGHEMEVLEGAVEIITIDHPIFLIEAEERYHVGAVAKVQHFLQGFGYIGYFVYQGKVRPIHDFDFAKHQDINQIVSGPRNAYSDYINNFIFAPREWRVSLPHKVPSAWRAIYEAACRAVCGHLLIDAN
jgi:FkbM family methyltransferase